MGLIAFGLATARAAIFPSGAVYLMAMAGVLGLPFVVIDLSPWYALVPNALALLAVGWIALGLVSSDPAGATAKATALAADVEQAADPVAGRR